MSNIRNTITKHWRLQSLRAKLATAFLLTMLMPFFVLTLAIHFIGLRFTNTIVMERNQFFAEHVGVHLEQMLSEKISMLKLSAANPVMQSLDVRAQAEMLAAMVKLDSDLLIVMTVDRRGRQIARSDGKPPDPFIDYSDRPYFASALATKQTSFSNTQLSRSAGVLSVAASTAYFRSSA